MSAAKSGFGVTLVPGLRFAPSGLRLLNQKTCLPGLPVSVHWHEADMPLLARHFR
jgi:DNA-binding transcriptional LysR family regulator